MLNAENRETVRLYWDEFMRELVKLAVVLTWVLIPTAAYAQASIARST